MMTTLKTTAPITLISDPKVISIPIKELHEPMVDLREKGGILIGPSPEIENNQTYTQMRYTVYKKLIEAQSRLPKNYFFCLYEAFRDPGLQAELFSKHYKNTQKRHPSWSQEEVFKEATKLFSPMYHLDGSLNIPPHCTGAALDLYLVDPSGMSYDMGIHPKDWMQDADGSLSQTQTAGLSLEAQKNRSIMSRALSSVGFVNYPTEYWHWSYGDRYWAFHKHKAYAIYGMVETKK